MKQDKGKIIDIIAGIFLAIMFALLCYLIWHYGEVQNARFDTEMERWRMTRVCQMHR